MAVPRPDPGGESASVAVVRNVFFSIPFAGRRDDAGWEISCRLLGNTLRSVLRQTDPAFEVVITGHEKPALEELGDPRVTFLTAPFDKPADPSGYCADKRSKRKNNAIYIKERGGGYITYLDSDDLVSRNLINYIRYNGDPNGYIFKTGYLMDYRTKVIGIYADFDKHCGSCAAIYSTAERIDPEGFGPFMTLHDGHKGHPLWQSLAAMEGRPLRPVPFPAAVYVVNTSQNISASMGEAKVRSRLKRIRRRQVAVTPEIVEEFSLAEIVPPRSRAVRLGGRVRALVARLRRGGRA